MLARATISLLVSVLWMSGWFLGGLRGPAGGLPLPARPPRPR